mmetsp:Transcript_21363/g.63619  ORF Transcript_21363/g.63619 Transcript_21363/m.63619 type:complete len:209 (+) Transcript_21363:1612-2238(+)
MLRACRPRPQHSQRSAQPRRRPIPPCRARRLGHSAARGTSGTRGRAGRPPRGRRAGWPVGLDALALHRGTPGTALLEGCPAMPRPTAVGIGRGSSADGPRVRHIASPARFPEWAQCTPDTPSRQGPPPPLPGSPRTAHGPFECPAVRRHRRMGPLRPGPLCRGAQVPTAAAAGRAACVGGGPGSGAHNRLPRLRMAGVGQHRQHRWRR